MRRGRACARRPQAGWVIGLGEQDLMEGIRQVPLAEGAALVLEADKVLTY
ncbi:MAG: hypothetical protein JRI25_23795 [Deltaproteobacteria bacterium]|nr:hypothetical protein [Deltaproteobacteria bacterium]